MFQYPLPPLSDGIVLLRSWTEQDLPALEQASLDSYIPIITSVPSPYTYAEGLRWLERQQQRVSENVAASFCIADPQNKEFFIRTSRSKKRAVIFLCMHALLLMHLVRNSRVIE